MLSATNHQFKTMESAQTTTGSSSISIDASKDAVLKSERLIAGIWDEKVVVADIGGEAASQFLYNLIQQINAAETGVYSINDVKLVSILPMEQHVRPSDENYLPPEALWRGMAPHVALSDGYPILIASESSLAELNRRLLSNNKKEIPMSRFRPNIVVKGGEPFEEDTWKTIEIDGSIFHVVKGCPRCKQSCTDQVTGERSEEPLETMSEFRSFGEDGDVYFAQNVVMQDRRGKIHLGAKVRVITRGEPVWNREAAQPE